MENQNDNDAFEPEVQPMAEVVALVRYTVTAADIEATRAEYAAITFDTTPGYELGRKAIAHCRKTRVEIERQRVAKKAASLEYGRKVDKGAKELTELIESIEKPLQEQKDAVDAERERAKREAAEAEKRSLEEKIRLEREVEEARLKAERDAEEARLRAEREAEEKRLAEERARLDAERAELERQQRELAEAKVKAEREEAARQAAIKAEAEAKEQAERDRVAAEEARVAEAERQAELARRLEALKPDAEKLRAFAADINTLTPPDVKSDEARQLLANVMSMLLGVVATLETFGTEEAASAAEE